VRGCCPPPKCRPAAPSRPTLSVEGSPSIRSITERHWLPPSSLPRCLISLLRSRPSLAGRQRGLLRSSLRAFRGKVVPFGRWRVIRDGGHCSPRTWPRTFWSEPDSIFGSSLFTAFISTSPGLTCPGRLAPDRRDAGSRRLGSRVDGRSRDRGYVVPRASDLAVAGDARRGSRPMAEHRVMSEDLLA
jgi:hypothetical protein